jgi:hypothetical protein
MHSLEALRSFPWTVLPSRLERIQRLHLTWAFPGSIDTSQEKPAYHPRDYHHLAAWFMIRSVIKQMEGLVELQLTLAATWFEDHPLPDTGLLDFLKDLKPLIKSVKLRVPLGIELEPIEKSLLSRKITGVEVSWAG